MISADWQSRDASVHSPASHPSWDSPVSCKERSLQVLRKQHSVHRSSAPSEMGSSCCCCPATAPWPVGCAALGREEIMTCSVGERVYMKIDSQSRSDRSIEHHSDLAWNLGVWRYRVGVLVAGRGAVPGKAKVSCPMRSNRLALQGPLLPSE